MIDVKWDSTENNTLLWVFTLPWTWDEFLAAKKEADALIDSVEGIVDCIFQTANQEIPPQGITHLRNMIVKRHNRSGLLVVVGHRMFLSTFLNLIVSSIPGVRHHFHYVDRLPEAHAVIQQAQQKRGQAVAH